MQLMGTGMEGGGAFIPIIHENDAMITVVIIKVNILLEITHVTVLHVYLITKSFYFSLIIPIVKGDRKFENGF